MILVGIGGAALLVDPPIGVLTALSIIPALALAVPAVMVPNRVYLDAHTWAQGVVGLLLAAMLVAGAFRL